MLTLRELRRAAALAEERLAGARLVRAVQPDRFALALVLESGGRGAPRERRALLLSVRPGLGRISVLDEAPPAPETPGPLAQFLRAHGVGTRLAGASVAPGDRIVTLRFEGEDPWSLRLSLMGARSNAYLCDGSDLVRMSLRPLEETRRDLAPGEPWRDPEPLPRPEGDDRFADVPDPDFFAALEREAAEKARTGAAGDLAGELRRALRRRTQQIERKLELLEEDLRAGERAAALEQAGELLKSNLARVRKGASELWVEDPASGAGQAIPLDPALSPAANLEEIFRRYRKELRRASRAGEEMGTLRDQERRVRELSAAVDAAAAAGGEAEALQEIAALPDVARLLARARPQERAAEAPAKPRRRGPPGVPARLQPRRYRSETGLEIWVGRSDEGNDRLSTRLARGNDLFFHLDGSPGSHVVLRTEGRSDPPSEAVLEACELAVHFSKQRGASRAAVHVAPIKNVRKPKGAKPGLVFVHGGRTVQLRHEPARLRRTLEARIEEADE